MFVVEKDNKIILADEDRDRLKSTLEFMPDYAGCEIVETDRKIAEIDGMYVYADSAEYKSKQAQERIAVLKAEIAAVDYKQFKYLRGELSAEEWEEVKAYIQVRTAEINELELVVDNGEIYV